MLLLFQRFFVVTSKHVARPHFLQFLVQGLLLRATGLRVEGFTFLKILSFLVSKLGSCGSRLQLSLGFTYCKFSGVVNGLRFSDEIRVVGACCETCA